MTSQDKTAAMLLDDLVEAVSAYMDPPEGRRKTWPMDLYTAFKAGRAASSPSKTSDPEAERDSLARIVDDTVDLVDEVTGQRDALMKAALSMRVDIPM